jgi:hypothetical protein
MSSVFTEVCRKCGSEYTITKIKLIMRDIDKIDCDVCGEELMHWNGAVMYTSKLTKRGDWPKNQLIK